MSVVISADKICVERSAKVLLSKVSLGVSAGDTIGVVGQNGGGKSTLLQVLAHIMEPDSGCVITRNASSIGYLAQRDAFKDTDLVRDVVFQSLETYEWAQDPLKRSLVNCLLQDVSFDTTISQLSGGQRHRCDLARVLLGSWDVLLLDEPTNHLDMTTIAWLASYLKDRKRIHGLSSVIVTHDRWFLDEVCDHMWEVHDGCVDPFEGGYSAYIQQRVERERLAEVAETKRQNMLRKELNWLAHGAKARSSKPKFRVEAALEMVALDPPLRNSIELKALAATRLGKQVITLEHVACTYGSHQVIKPLDWIIGPGERIGIVGENGSGKSSLLRIMTLKQVPSQGVVKVGKSVVFGIVDQHLSCFSHKENQTVEHVLAQSKSNVYIDGKSYTPMQLFERLGFRNLDQKSRLCDLSGGQLRRLALMITLLEQPNVLVLDEPGNDLDTDMLAALEDVLDSWAATLLLVTHDRHLMERVCDDIYALLNRELIHMPRGIDEYMQRLASQDKDAGSSHALDSGSMSKNKDRAAKQQRACDGVSRYELKKQCDAVLRKLTKQQDEPDRIQKLMQACDGSDYEQLAKLQKQLSEAQRLVDELETQWLTLSEKLESL